MDFYYKKLKKEYKEFLKRRPSFKDFVSGFINKNDLFGIPEGESSTKPFDMEAYIRVQNAMKGMDDSVFVPSTHFLDHNQK